MFVDQSPPGSLSSPSIVLVLRVNRPRRRPRPRPRRFRVMWSRTRGQVLTVCCPEGTRDSLSRRDSRAFVPEGLNDRSQAIYCLERVQKGAPSRRDGMSRPTRCIYAQGIRTSRRPIIPFPTGRNLFFVATRHFVPGYLRLVPQGQSPTSPFGTKTLNSCPRSRLHIIPKNLRARARRRGRFGRTASSLYGSGINFTRPCSNSTSRNRFRVSRSIPNPFQSSPKNRY
jgi:hypothetical protein